MRSQPVSALLLIGKIAARLEPRCMLHASVACRMLRYKRDALRSHIGSARNE